MEAGGERLIRVPTSLSSLLATAKMWKRYRRMAILSENSQNTPHKTPINFHSTCGYVHECQSSEWTETSCHALTTIKSNSASTMISEWFRLVYLSRCFWLIFDRRAFQPLLMKQAKKRRWVYHWWKQLAHHRYEHRQSWLFLVPISNEEWKTGASSHNELMYRY